MRGYHRLEEGQLLSRGMAHLPFSVLDVCGNLPGLLLAIYRGQGGVLQGRWFSVLLSFALQTLRSPTSFLS